jgi:nitrite reductase/ring-hydroxylating ferredoxin subunit
LADAPTPSSAPSTEPPIAPPNSKTNLRSIDRLEGLVVASVYEREIAASLERIWENVRDWEHLPWLHSQAFSSIERLDSGGWGWHARIGLGAATDAQIELELVIDEPELRYVSRTLAGAGSPSEIWTQLVAVSEHRTAIRVEFCVNPAPEEALRQIGAGYVSLYRLLWDQDEEMMQIREAALSDEGLTPSAPDASAPLLLGTLDTLREQLPLVTSFGGRRYCVAEVAGELFAYDIRCPHMWGPLDEAEIVDGQIECPWHGYRFDARSGRSRDGRGLRLSKAPRVLVDPDSGEVELVAMEGSN